MTLMRLAFALALIAALPLDGALAQQTGAKPPQAGANADPPKAQTAQVGAGTTDGATTGSSGPEKKGGGSGPTQPSNDLCADYKGDVQAACLYVEMNQQPQPQGGSQ